MPVAVAMQYPSGYPPSRFLERLLLASPITKRGTRFLPRQWAIGVASLREWRSYHAFRPDRSEPVRHVVEAGSITHGAERAHLALAAASTRIRHMEEALGAALLTRGRAGVTPTQAGRTLLQHARTILGQAERLREDLGAYAGGLGGQVRVLSNTNALTEFLPETLSSFLCRASERQYRPRGAMSDEMVGLIAEGVADLGIVAGTVDRSELETYPFRKDRFVVVVATRSSARARAEIAFADVLVRFRRPRPRERVQRSSPTRRRAPDSRCGCASSCAASTRCAAWSSAASASASCRRPRRAGPPRPWRSSTFPSPIPRRCATSRSACAASRELPPTMHASWWSICGRQGVVARGISTQ